MHVSVSPVFLADAVRPARFVDVGVLEPALFHATYTGIAHAQASDAEPVVMWGRARPHVSLGQSQNRHAELAEMLDVPAVTRALGGGTVWIDESQFCFVLIAPRQYAPALPAGWFDWGLAPAIATYRHFGLVVRRCEQDLWLDSRKIAGSGAATIGSSAVLASSFLLHFSAGRFARCIAAPLSRRGRSVALFHRSLTAALELAMTDWASHCSPPAPDDLRAAFRCAVKQTLGWTLADSTLAAPEAAAREEVLAEMAEEQPRATGRRRVANGIKLNAGAYFTEQRRGGRILRKLIVTAPRIVP